MEKRLDLGKMLGAAEAAASQVLTLYVPDRDRDGRKVREHQMWVDEALRLLARIGGGATCLTARGSWFNDQTRKTIVERTAIIYTYVDPERFMRELPALRGFLHGFGRKTNQGEVVFEFDSLFYRVRKYEEA